MVFISHSKNDKVLVQEIIKELKIKGVNVWDDRKIKSGTSWKKAIFKAITESSAMIIFLSKSYIESPMCRMEAFLAQCYGVKIIPVMIKEECWSELHGYSELSLMSDFSVLNLVNNQMFGLKKSKQEQLNELVQTIKGDKLERFKNCDLFISYRAQDAIYATKIAQDLYNSKKIKTWIATLAYEIGENWQKGQWEALMNVKGLIVILRKEISESEYIRKEILVALTRGIPIYPVLIDSPEIGSNNFLRELNTTLDDTKSFEMRELNEIQWFYPNKPNYESMLDEIVENHNEKDNVI